MSVKMNRHLFILILIPLLFIAHSTAISKASSTITYDISKKDVIIQKSGNYIITGSTSKYTITVLKGVKANISLKNLTIKNTSKESETFEIKNGASVNLTLYGTNHIESSYAQGSGIHVPNGAKLEITKKSTGKLTVIADNGAGIGGSRNNPTGETGIIIINGGTIYAKGDYDNCGIGGGGANRYSSDFYSQYYIGGGDITINGGFVTAIGGDDTETGGCAGIGGASLTRQGKITINGGTIYASSKEAGIGGESDLSKGNKITITGGIVTAKGEQYGAAIGNTRNFKGTTVTISGGEVTAKGDFGSRTLYAAYVGDSINDRNKYKSYDIAAEKITITGGQIDAYNFSIQPVNAKNEEVNRAFLHCQRGNITSITLDSDTYGCKDMISKGYLSVFAPVTFKQLLVKSGNKILYNDSITSSVYMDFTGNISTSKTLELDISKGDIHIINNICIYQNKVYRSKSFTITGSTDRYQVFVRSNYFQEQNLILKDVKVDYLTTKKQDFMILDNNISLNLELVGNNSIVLGDSSRGFYVGHDASLNFSGADTDTLFVKAGANTNAIYSNYGSINQYGGNITFDLGDDSTAIYVGNYGTFSLYSGKFEAHSKKGSCITGLSSLRVNIHGGTLIADMVGILENGNEEVVSRAYFTMSGGEIKVNRIIFADYTIYNGLLDAYILGSGTGCNVTMYGGNLEIGTYIDYSLEIMETDIKKERILGGTVNQRNDVPLEILEKIKTNQH
ncbi:MAG: hypothetical protein ACK5JH_08700 [Anaerocolumna sp.]